MEKILQKSWTIEANCRSEKLNKLDKEHTVYLGRLAIRSDYLGINDPVTHLFQYLERGESSLIGIKEDIETAIAERLPKTPFVNYVNFEFSGNDFVSVKDKVSMNSMTQNNLQILKEELVKNPDLQSEYVRAEIEAQEVSKLANWFKDAPIGASMVFESLPISKQEKYAILRIYKKASDKKLEGCFVSLYNPSIEQFNELHKILGVNVPLCQNETEILQNNYEFYNPDISQPNKFNNFIDYYTEIYDQLLEIKDGQKYSFGIENDKKIEKQNGIKKVRNQPRLTAVYADTIKTLAASGGIATTEIIKINDQLETGYKLVEKQNLSIEIVHDILKNVILGITSAINKADSDLLEKLEQSYVSSDANFSTVTHYAEQAKAANETYSSNGCPEISRNSITEKSTNETNYENDVMKRAFNINNKLPNNFGKPSIGVCRITSCPSRGEIWWWPDKTLVGGCSVCTCCHKIFEKGQSPELVYSERENRHEQKAKQIAKLESNIIMTKTKQKQKTSVLDKSAEIKKAT